ncbi:MAG TPA: DUF1501 domain-containing protein [Kofleriaceae bacterium]|nr:DUF1501 domain-containing protein [Kofleriaceae bacterium]
MGATSATALVAPYVMRKARAEFGVFPSGSEAAMLPASMRAKRVLEVFLYGGLSPWETLYFVRNYGTPSDPQYANQQYYTFATSNDAMLGTTRCNAGSFSTQRPFASDALGAQVEIGPFGNRLVSRTDVTDRMRLIVQKHNLEPHEAAVPQALTGRPVGQPNAAGLGAHIQRARLASTPDRASPHSYVFATGGISSDNVAAAAAAGAHPGAARPLLIKTDNASGFTNLLKRQAVGTAREHHDALVDVYATQYSNRLKWPSGERVRSARMDDFNVAFGNQRKVDAISGVLSSDLFTTQGGNSCGTSKQKDIPLMGLSAAAKLLTHPTEPASYVCVSDVGLYEASGGGGYDTHSDNARDTAVNFDHMLKNLLAIINAPGENDPRKLNLDDTLIILNTEFGRTPTAQGSTGRNHHPYGYVTAFIGGPTVKGIGGAIGPDAQATEYATPAQNRIAALLSLGIWPFAQEGFAVSDVPNASGELDAAVKSMQFCLGRTA